MKLRPLVLFGTLAGSALACAQREPVLTDAHVAAMRDSVSAFLEDFRRFSAASQWDSLGALYSDRSDFRFLESGEVRYESAGAIRAAFRQVPPGVRIETTNRNVTVQPIAPGLAVVSSLFDTEFKDSARTQFGYGGALTMVVQHEPAGWRIVSGHSSAPVPRGQ
jgi:ketosteroid isomerase-like protein